ncbi:MAG: hypothetical protein FD147_2590 [Chloroflexi bacterium]|nr:MAG: hypothetical protein FD147_2590 [Chloroflexota bacterium]
MTVTIERHQTDLHLLSLQDRRGAYLAAKEKLSEEDQQRIDKMIHDLVAAVKAKHTYCQFPLEGAMEVIAALGIFLNRRKT